MRALEIIAKQQRALQHLISCLLGMPSVLLAASSDFTAFVDLASRGITVPSAPAVTPRQS